MTETIKELAPYLTALADKLSTTADKVWAMQLLQAKVTMISMIAGYAMNIIGVWLWIKGVLWFMEYRKEINNEGLDITAMIVGVVVSIFIIVYTFANFNDVKVLVTLIVNPEYWALKELLRMVK